MTAATTPWLDYARLGLFTDLYELSMLQAYVERGVGRERHLQPLRAPAARAAQLSARLRPG